MQQGAGSGPPPPPPPSGTSSIDLLLDDDDDDDADSGRPHDSLALRNLRAFGESDDDDDSKSKWRRNSLNTVFDSKGAGLSNVVITTQVDAKVHPAAEAYDTIVVKIKTNLTARDSGSQVYMSQQGDARV